ncbi:MAG TPA: zinc-binding dehydrogenase [Anaerovoracaceae bacterium]|nr:zinc-binding dehydrogenase [Anaerovoracaceae bacterium]
MRAIVKAEKGPGGIKLCNVTEPQPDINEVKIKVHAGGICGTDLHIMKDEGYAYRLGVTMGHEYSGVIVEIGSGVSKFQTGDRVVSLTAGFTCGQCRYCREGLLMLCEDRLSIGSGMNGAFAEYIVIPESLVFKLPDSVSLDAAALCEPLACTVRNVIEFSKVKAGDYVLVSGPGTIGQLVMQLVHQCGAKVMMTGTSVDADRLRVASETGADRVVNISAQDPEKEMNEFTKGEGFDVAFECAGAAASADLCLRLLRKSGQYSQVGLFGKPVVFDHDLALKKEIHIVNSFASERTSWETALRLLEWGKINTDVLISHKYKFEDFEDAFAAALNKEGFKILLTP